MLSLAIFTKNDVVFHTLRNSTGLDKIAGARMYQDTVLYLYLVEVE